MKNSLRLALFSFLAYFLIAVGILALVEVALRLFYDAPLRRVKSVNAYLNEQPWKLQRLFVADGKGGYATSPDPFFIGKVQYQRFRMPKEKGAFRIFCVGESAVAGWSCGFTDPGPGTDFPAQLRRVLAKDFKNIEVINAGIGAVTSEALVAVVEELISYQPDCVILYAGHNEYGYYFWNRRILETDPLFFQADAFLSRLYLYRFILKVTNRSLEDCDPAQTWKKYDAREGSALIDKKYRRIIPTREWERFSRNELFFCEKAFEKNLLRMGAALKQSGVQFMICTLASNLRDFPPFVSFHSSGISAKDLKRWEDLYAAVVSSARGDKSDRALSGLEELLRLDPGYAETRYLLGEVYYARGKFEPARENFILARDLSPAYAPYQRATSALNRLIREISRENRIALIDIEDDFFRFPDNHGIPGNDMFCDNLHPNEKGHAFIAGAIASRLKKLLEMRPAQ